MLSSDRTLYFPRNHEMRKKDPRWTQSCSLTIKIWSVATHGINNTNYKSHQPGTTMKYLKNSIVSLPMMLDIFMFTLNAGTLPGLKEIEHK